MHSLYGNHWSKISARLSGRTDNAVKNFYYSRIRKRIRKLTKSFGLQKKSENSKRISTETHTPVPICIPKVLYEISKPTPLRLNFATENIEDEAPAILCSLSEKSSTQDDELTLKMEDNLLQPILLQTEIDPMSRQQIIFNQYYYRALYYNYFASQSMPLINISDT